MNLKYVPFVDYEGKSQEEKLIYTLRLTYKVFFIIMLFLLLPTMGFYMTGFKILMWARDLGIFITFIYTYRIRKAMKKKEKEEGEK